METLSTKLKQWYYLYLTHTSLYMLETWERCLFTSLLVMVIAMASYTTYLFLPGHLMMWYRFIEYYILGEPLDTESTSTIHASDTFEGTR